MTPKQYKLLEYIRNTIAHSGKSPTFSEMCIFMQVNSKQTIYDFLLILQRERYLYLGDRKQRGITLTKKSELIPATAAFTEEARLRPASMIRIDSSSIIPALSNSGEFLYLEKKLFINLERNGTSN